MADDAKDSPPDWRHAPGLAVPPRRPSKATLSSLSARPHGLDLATTLRKPLFPPPPLIGASTVLIRNKLYIFGGRTVNGTFSAAIYALDLDGLTFQHIAVDSADPEAPEPRYFHSAVAYKDFVVVYGGLGPAASPSTAQSSSDEDEDTGNGALPSSEGAMQLFDRVHLFNTLSQTWVAPSPSLAKSLSAAPLPRYAHLASLAGPGRMLIAGGQALNGSYVNQLAILNLETFTWESCSTLVEPSRLGSSRAFFASSPLAVQQQPHILAYSTPIETPPVHLFSNSLGSSSSGNVKRSMHVLRSTPERHQHQLEPANEALPHSSALQPPSFRFPQGSIIGQHMLVTGVVLSGGEATYEVWTLTMAGEGESQRHWRRLPTGRSVFGGAWTRSVVWRNRLVLFGDAEGDLAFEFERRQTSWFNVAFVDLEAFGIYQPPRLALAPVAQEAALEALSQPALADYAILCSDGRRLGCSRKILEDRWPWFRERLAKAAGGHLPGGSDSEDDEHETLRRNRPLSSASQNGALPRCTMRALELGDSSDVVLPALRYFYCLSIPADLSVDLLSSLLCFAQAYVANHLRGLVVHALHSALERDPMLAPAVHEAAAVGRCTALQLRALAQLPRRASHATLRMQPSIASTVHAGRTRIPSVASSSTSAPSDVLPGIPSGDRLDVRSSVSRPSSNATSSIGTDLSKVTTSYTSPTSGGSATSSISSAGNSYGRTSLAVPDLLRVVEERSIEESNRTPKEAVNSAISSLFGRKKSTTNLGRQKSSTSASSGEETPQLKPAASMNNLKKQKVYYSGRGGAGKLVVPAAVKKEEARQRVNRQEAALRAAGVSNEVEIALWRIGELQGKAEAEKARAAVEAASKESALLSPGTKSSPSVASSSGRKSWWAGRKQ